jgi:hypothetical protein
MTCLVSLIIKGSYRLGTIQPMRKTMVLGTDSTMTKLKTLITKTK